MGAKERNTRGTENLNLDSHGTEHLETSVFGQESHEDRIKTMIPPPPPSAVWEIEESDSEAEASDSAGGEDSPAYSYSL